MTDITVFQRLLNPSPDDIETVEIEDIVAEIFEDLAVIEALLGLPASGGTIG